MLRRRQDTRSADKAHTVRKLYNEERFIWLEDLGFGTDINHEFPALPDELAGVNPVRLQGAHIALWWKYTRLSLDISIGDVQLMDPSLTNLWSTFMNGFETNPVAAVALQKQGKASKQIMSTSGLVLVSVFESSPGAGHWTLIVTDKTAEDAVVC